MENLFIRISSKTPLIHFDALNGVFELRGRSTIDNTKAFYEPICKWIEEYVNQPAQKTSIDIALDYYNTSSQMWIFRMLHKLTELKNGNTEIYVTWYYRDDDMKTIGEELALVIHHPIALEFSNKMFEY